MCQIDSETKLTGLIGYPIGHTLSPLLHNSAYKHLNLNWCYLPLQVKKADLHDALAGLKALSFVGVNITMPHKESVLEYMDELDSFAQLVGAINAIHIIEGKFIGYNTDAQGFLLSLKKDARFKSKNKRVLVVGAGGAAKAVAIALATEEASQITILNRTLERAVQLANFIEKKFLAIDVQALSFEDKLAPVISKADLIVNATPIGMELEQTNYPIPVDFLHPSQLVFDLIYKPVKTPFLREAEEKGANILNGLGMLLYQGAAAFEIWTGVKAPVDVMKKSLQEAIKSKGKVK
jgi:shikimate dehydrogenase